MNLFVQRFGLHPLTALGMICVDMMLFGPDMTGIGWIISVPVAILLTIPCILLQKYAYGDTWQVSVGKGMILGVLTAIPTPLPAVVTGAGGILGAIGAVKGLIGNNKDEAAPPEIIDVQVIEPADKKPNPPSTLPH